MHFWWGYVNNKNSTKPTSWNHKGPGLMFSNKSILRSISFIEFIVNRFLTMHARTQSRPCDINISSIVSSHLVQNNMRVCCHGGRYCNCYPGTRLTKTYDVTFQRYHNSHAKIKVRKCKFLRYVGSQFCVKFQRCPLNFYTKCWIHTPQNMHLTRS